MNFIGRFNITIQTNIYLCVNFYKYPIITVWHTGNFLEKSPGHLMRYRQEFSLCCISWGCKHIVSFIIWLHRKSEEPFLTENNCYWKKSLIADVGTRYKYVLVKNCLQQSNVAVGLINFS